MKGKQLPQRKKHSNVLPTTQIYQNYTKQLPWLLILPCASPWVTKTASLSLFAWQQQLWCSTILSITSSLMSKIANVSNKEFCIKRWHWRPLWSQVSCIWLCSVDIVLSYFHERFDKMPSVTENPKFEVWNCALIGEQKMFLYIFFKTACILSNHSEFYETITFPAPYYALHLSPRQLGIMPLFHWKFGSMSTS